MIFATAFSTLFALLRDLCSGKSAVRARLNTRADSRRRSLLAVVAIGTVQVASQLQGCDGAGRNDAIVVDPLVSLNEAFAALPAVTRPLALIQSPADNTHWYTIEQRGRVLRFANSESASTLELVLDISARVDDSFNESGLLGMAFHPDFASNGRVFLSYTIAAEPLVSIISEFAVSTDGVTLDPASERIVLQVEQDRGNHNGGQIDFGPDGYLYIGLGDGGSAINRAQDRTNLLGSILRLDVNRVLPYAIPADNPHVGNPLCAADHTSTLACPELYAWGLRNPWRWSFDRSSGRLWAGDVGENNFEEINLIESGNDYGWSTREGDRCFASRNCDAQGLTDPVVQYSHSEGVAVTGGYVYRGIEIANLAGQYLFGDFGSGMIWSFDLDSAQRTPLINSDLAIASFAQDERGEVYVIDLFQGRFYRLGRPD